MGLTNQTYSEYKMGDNVDPSERKKYTIEELIKLVGQFEQIQVKINELAVQARKYNKSIKDENLEIVKNQIEDMIEKRQKVFSTKILRHTIISGVHL